MARLNKPSRELVFDLINAANPQLPYPVNANNIVIEQITTVPVNAASNQRNTKARVRGVQGQGYTDSQILYYDRIAIGSLLPAYHILTPAGAPVSFTAATLHALLPVFNEKYGLALDTSDVTNVAIGSVAVPSANPVTVMTMTTTSLAFTGAAYFYTQRGKPVLDTSITDVHLQALKHPIPITNKQCIDLLTFGLDFTGYKNLLNITSAGLPNWAGLRNVLDGLGIPTYPAPLNSNYVADQTTASVANANKTYDRVVVQTGIDADGVAGVAYYHYNN